MSQDLQGKVALITGASSGIGAATASAFLAAGARVAVAARRRDRLLELGQQPGAREDRLLVIEADVRSDEAAAALIDRTLSWGGRLDVLVNNAGLSRGNLHEGMSPEDIRLILDTNVYALMNLTRLAVAPLKAARGDVVNISSTAALALIPGTAVYAGSKAAVAAFSEVLRKELAAHDVRVTAIYPGLVQSEFFDGFEPAKREALLNAVAAMDALHPEDLAEAILFAVTRPHRVSLNEIVIRPTKQPA